MMRLFVLAMFVCALNPARADEIDQCIAKLRSAHEEPQQFAQQGEVTCPPGDIVGFPPKLRTNNREANVTYPAPAGKIIRNDSVSSIRVENVSGVNGEIGNPTVSPDGRTVTVPISCKGKNITEGRAWQEIRITGTIVRTPSQDDLKSWILNCVKCVSEKNCP